METPGEQTRSELITSARTDTALKPLSGVFRHVLAEHGGAFAQVKRLGMRSELQGHSELEREGCVAGCLLHEEMVEGYAALRAIVEAEHLLENDAHPSDLAEAMAALDAINPGSPEWGPTFLQVSELVQAHLHEAEGASVSTSEEENRLCAAC